MPLLVETITPSTMVDLLAARDRSQADIVELRLDGVADVDVAGALGGRTRPVIVTCRPVWEGGRFDGSEDERERILRSAIDGGAEFVDVEWRARGAAALAALAPGRVVLSSHDFTGVPRDLALRVRDMRRLGTLIKVAVTPAGLSDVLPLRDVGRHGNAVVVAMGDAGFPTRVLAAHFGSRWSYAGQGAAPGQIPAARMLREFRFRDVGPGTRVYGLLGRNASHSVSPAMHNAAFAAAGLDAVYVPLVAADFADFTTFAEAIGLAGASVTIPWKVDALRLAARAEGDAQVAGAANTLRRLDGAWEAANTDLPAFLETVAEAWRDDLRGVRASVLGAGGSARAVAVALRSRGARVTIHARRVDQAEEVASVSGALVGPFPPRPRSWDLLVNCTPLGSAAARDESPLPAEALTGRLVYDLTYGPSESPLMRDARAAGCRVVDGLPMLVAQAERQFEWWTGKRPRAGLMKAAADARLGRQQTTCG